MNKVWCGLVLLLAASAQANDSFNSEFSHFAGGAVMAGGLTALSDHYWPQKDRFWVGFGGSAAAGFVGEGMQFAFQGRFSLLDAGSHALGSLVGAWVTDGWILSPVMGHDQYGLTFYYPF